MARKRTKTYRKKVGAHTIGTTYRMFNGNRYWLAHRCKTKRMAKQLSRGIRTYDFNARVVKVGKMWYVYESAYLRKGYDRKYRS